ncbi:unnamed protein product [Peniophora sp. CBMAI 1063]|nr:unnamed protein product [Peniophora sp. CBMAI 1063]
MTDVPPSPEPPTTPPPRRKKKKSERQRLSPDTPLDEFFGSFEGFQYNPRKPTMSEFNRLCRERGWGLNSPERHEARARLRDALIRQFELIFGTEVRSLRSWQLLCTAIGLEDIPDTLKECRELVEEVYVNLIDLIEKMRLLALNESYNVRLFENETKLAEYTTAADKILPRPQAKGLLMHLLRHIKRPRPNAQSTLPRFTSSGSNTSGSGNDSDELHEIMEGLALA